jgi:hypothetical protein
VLSGVSIVAVPRCTDESRGEPRMRSSEGAALLAAILAVIAPILPAIATTANAARHDRSGPRHCCGARDRPSAE